MHRRNYKFQRKTCVINPWMKLSAKDNGEVYKAGLTLSYEHDYNLERFLGWKEN